MNKPAKKISAVKYKTVINRMLETYENNIEFEEKSQKSKEGGMIFIDLYSSIVSAGKMKETIQEFS